MYVILRYFSPSDLEKKVNDAIHQGAILQGGVAYNKSPETDSAYSTTYWAQAVLYPVKEETKAEVL